MDEMLKEYLITMLLLRAKHSLSNSNWHCCNGSNSFFVIIVCMENFMSSYVEIKTNLSYKL